MKAYRAALRWAAVPLLALYWAVMCIKRMDNSDKLTKEAEPYAKAIAYFGLFVDFVYNWTWAIFYFGDLPREILVTQRLERYKYGKSYRLRASGIWHNPKTWRIHVEKIQVSPEKGWRLTETDWMEINLLGPADPQDQHVRP